MSGKTSQKTNITVKITSLLVSFIIALSPTFVLAEDHPTYMGGGYRDYLGGKVQNGYFVEVFADMDMRQNARVDRRNEIEKLVDYSYKAGPQNSNGILAVTGQTKYNADVLNQEINQQNAHRQQIATAELASGFSYIPHSDGRVDYFKDGLLIRTENERVVDQFGNLSIKNTYNIQYNDLRLMISYQASITDNLGNTSYQRWYGASYSSDSVYYGNNETVANKNVMEYYLEEIDSAGNVKLTHWTALSYEGKLVRAFHQRVEDSVYGIMDFTRTNIQYLNDNPEYVYSYHEEGIGTDGLSYTLDRTDIAYNDLGQLCGYHEVKYTTMVDGTVTKTTTDATFTYQAVPMQFGPDVEQADPSRLVESTITTTVENADGSFRTETTTTTYTYDAGLNLIGASGHTEFSGRESNWYEYTDAAGNTLNMRVDENGNVTYSYIDPATQEAIEVPADQVITTLKAGDLYVGTSDAQYEIVFGMPMVKETTTHTSFYGELISEDQLVRTEDSTVTYTNGLVNNLRRVLGTSEHTEIAQPMFDYPDNSHITVRDMTTSYVYAENGNLIDLIGTGTSHGFEYTNGAWREYTATITEEYDVILGLPVRTDYYEDREYPF